MHKIQMISKTEITKRITQSSTYRLNTASKCKKIKYVSLTANRVYDERKN